LCKKITKDDLVKLGAWYEVEKWFKEIKECVDRAWKKER
jgi:hypothetical protein